MATTAEKYHDRNVTSKQKICTPCQSNALLWFKAVIEEQETPVLLNHKIMWCKLGPKLKTVDSSANYIFDLKKKKKDFIFIIIQKKHVIPYPAQCCPPSNVQITGYTVIVL